MNEKKVHAEVNKEVTSKMLRQRRWREKHRGERKKPSLPRFPVVEWGKCCWRAGVNGCNFLGEIADGLCLKHYDSSPSH